MKLLIVAEVAPIVVGLEHFFTRAGFLTDTSWSAEEATDKIQHDAGIAIVIWDLELRGSGQARPLLTKATQIERFDDRGPVEPPRFIFLGGPADRKGSVAESQMRQFAHLVSPGNVVHKPLDKNDLLRRVQTLHCLVGGKDR
jgi:hypothetical protein